MVLRGGRGVKQIAHSLMSTKNRIVIHQLCYMRVIYEHQVEVPFASQKNEEEQETFYLRRKVGKM